VLGTTAQKRALFDAICGEPLFAGSTGAPAPIVVRLRRGATLGFVATKSDGNVLEPEPDRSAHLDVQIQKLEAELDRANDLVTQLRRELGGLRDSVRPPPIVEDHYRSEPPPEP